MARVAIESLEARTLMAQTVGQLVTQIAGDVAASKATVAASAKIASADQHTLSVDLLKTGKANAALLKTLGKDFRAALANIRGMQVIANKIGVTDMRKAAAAIQTAVNHNLSAKTLAAANKALAQLAKDDNTFVSGTVFNAFYSVTAVPANDEETIRSSNPTNTTLLVALPPLEARANFSSALYPQFDALVEDISTFATYIVNNIPGTVF